jgi:uncharacterized damage-inducible protein DinB
MQTYFEHYLNNLQELHNDISSALENLPPAALDWPPGNEMNSISVMVVHTLGAQRYLAGEIIAGEASARDREAEFKARGLDAAELKKRLADSLDTVRSVTEGLTLADLEAPRMFRNQREVTVGWVLGHLLKHTATHLGQIQLTRQLWEQKK